MFRVASFLDGHQSYRASMHQNIRWGFYSLAFVTVVVSVTSAIIAMQ